MKEGSGSQAKAFSISCSPDALGTTLALGTAPRETVQAGMAPYLPILFLCPLEPGLQALLSQ